MQVFPKVEFLDKKWRFGTVWVVKVSKKNREIHSKFDDFFRDLVFWAQSEQTAGGLAQAAEGVASTSPK